MFVSPRVRPGRGRAALRTGALSLVAAASLLVTGTAAPVRADPLDAVDDTRTFDIDQIPEHVLDDGTVVVTEGGIIIDEPEPFAGWPAAIIAQSVQPSQPSQPTGLAPDTASQGDRTTSEAPSASEAFTLHSRPGADRTIFLDFDGHTTTGTEWNTNGRPESFTSAPYSRDSSPAFNDSELRYIGEIWEQVAEDFAPFDVDVTTQEPDFDDLWRSSSSDSIHGTRVVISPTNDWYGSSGGVAYVGSFSWSNERSPSGEPVVTPAFVFSDALAGGVPKYVAEAAAHEAGHTLGLYHDGKDSSGYYGGHTLENGSSRGGWAPIMGVGYQRDITQWSNGDYPGATQSQDDIAILASRLGWSSSGSSVVGPDTLSAGQSVVGTVTKSTENVDVDLVVDAGTASITIVPAVPASNLLASAQLLRGSTVIATAAPNTAVGWQLDFTEQLAAGVYTVRLRSIGWGDVTVNDLDGFSAYGSLGQFRISLEVEPDTSTVTTTNPTTTTTTTTTTSPTTTTTTTTTSPTTTTTTTTSPTTTSPKTTTTTSPTTTTTNPTSTTTTTTRPTTPPTTLAPTSKPLSPSGPAGCDTVARGGLMGYGRQQAAEICFSPAQRLG